MKLIKLIFLFLIPFQCIASNDDQTLKLDIIISPVKTTKQVDDATVTKIDKFIITPVITNITNNPLTLPTRGGIYYSSFDDIYYEVYPRFYENKTIFLSPSIYGLINLQGGMTTALPPIIIDISSYNSNIEISFSIDKSIGDQLNCWYGDLDMSFIPSEYKLFEAQLNQPDCTPFNFAN